MAGALVTAFPDAVFPGDGVQHAPGKIMKIAARCCLVQALLRPAACCFPPSSPDRHCLTQCSSAALRALTAFFFESLPAVRLTGRCPSVCPACSGHAGKSNSPWLPRVQVSTRNMTVCLCLSGTAPQWQRLPAASAPGRKAGAALQEGRGFHQKVSSLFVVADPSSSADALFRMAVSIYFRRFGGRL